MCRLDLGHRLNMSEPFRNRHSRVHSHDVGLFEFVYPRVEDFPSMYL